MKSVRIINLSKDFIYNFLSSAVMTASLQLVMYPVIAKVIGSEEYGLMLTIIGVINTIATSFAGALNNTHLIKNDSYIKNNIKGDFNTLFIFSTSISIFSSSLIFIFFVKVNVLLVVSLSVLIFLQSFRNYYSVIFRIKLDFKSNFIHKIIISIGYLAGLFLVVISSQWIISFLIGELLGIVYLTKKTSLHKSNYEVTVMFKVTIKTFIVLVFANIMANIFIYFDRLFIYPILGPESVSIYSVASYFGKSLAIVMTPIASVLLSYYSKSNFIMTTKKFWLINFIGGTGTALFIVISLFLSPVFTRLLFPDIFLKAESLVFIANTAASIGIFANLVQPAIIKFAPTIWQIIITIVYGLVYLSLSFILVKKYELLGFAISVIISNLLRLTMLLIIGAFYIMKKRTVYNADFFEKIEA